jgi:hypothetical protein
MDYVKANSLSPQSIGGEDKIQEIIANDPSVLGLGENLKWIEREKRLPGKGKLDVLLEEPGNNKRYAVEIQLGATDESHIIRTIEYWDLLERNDMVNDYVAVIVAEELTKRFFNVIRILNERIPLIAIQMSCMEVAGHATLAFTKVLDHSPKQLGLEEGEPASKGAKENWEKYAGPENMQLANEIFGIAQKFNDSLRLNYTQSYLAINIGASNRLTACLWPMKKHVRVGLVLEQSEELDKRFEDANIDARYESGWRMYLFPVKPSNFEMHKALLQDLMKLLYSGDSNDSEF